MIDKKLIDTLLEYDPLGKDYQKSPVMALSAVAMHSDMKEMALSATGDTYHGISYDEYLETAKKAGFNIAYEEEFSGIEKQRKLHILRYKDTGIILFTEESDFGNINNARIYFNYRPNGNETFHLPISGGMIRKTCAKIREAEKEAVKDLPKDTHYKVDYEIRDAAAKKWMESNPDQLIYSGDIDVREALIRKMEKLLETVEVLCPWVEPPFLWFVTWSETQGEYDYKKITRDRVAKMPTEIQEIIGEIPQ